MGQRIRVMIADDSAVIRRLVAEGLHSEPEFEVYAAVHGRDAIDQISQVRPDVVVLDFEMPIMGGVEAVLRDSPDRSSVADHHVLLTLERELRSPARGDSGQVRTIMSPRRSASGTSPMPFSTSAASLLRRSGI